MICWRCGLERCLAGERCMEMYAVHHFDPTDIELIEWTMVKASPSTVRSGGVKGLVMMRVGPWRIRNVAVYQSGNRVWVVMPRAAMRTDEGVIMKNAEGRVIHRPVIEWLTQESQDQFSTAVIDALKREYPQAIKTPPDV